MLRYIPKLMNSNRVCEFWMTGQFKNGVVRENLLTEETDCLHKKAELKLTTPMAVTMTLA